MRINADSEEYLDVCAVYTQDRSKLFKELMNHIENCEHYVRENVPNLGIKEPILLQIEDIKTKYNTWSDIPLIVAPTENGWPPLNVSRKIEPSTDSISYNLIVTSKNSNKINKKIRIKETPDSEGRVIEFL